MIFHSQSASRECFLGRRCFEPWVGEVLRIRLNARVDCADQTTQIRQNGRAYYFKGI